MWTTEYEFDSTVVTIVDDTAKEQDIILEMGEEHFDLRQYNEFTESYDLITMTPKMLAELLESFSQTEGLFHMVLRDPQQ